MDRISVRVVDRVKVDLSDIAITYCIFHSYGTSDLTKMLQFGGEVPISEVLHDTFGGYQLHPYNRGAWINIDVIS